MPADVVVLVPLEDGTESCGLGAPLTPAESSGALTNMGPLITLLAARLEDLLTLPGMTPGIDEVQQIDVGGNPPSSKSYTLAFSGSEPSAPLSVKSTALDVERALAGLSTIGAGNVQVSGANPTFQVTFSAALGNQDQPLLTADTSQLGGTVTITELTAGAAPGGQIKANSYMDSTGQLLMRLSDVTGANWVYKIIPAVRLDAPEILFLGRLVSGQRNDLPPPARREGPMEVKVPGWGRIGGAGVVAGAKLTVYEKGQPRTGTVQEDGTFTWDEPAKPPKARARA